MTKPVPLVVIVLLSIALNGAPRDDTSLPHLASLFATLVRAGLRKLAESRGWRTLVAGTGVPREEETPSGEVHATVTTDRFAVVLNQALGARAGNCRAVTALNYGDWQGTLYFEHGQMAGLPTDQSR